MKGKLTLLAELMQIAREGTILGLIRYVRFKRLAGGSPVGPDSSVSRSRGIGVVGAGTYAASVHLPCIVAHGAKLSALVSRSGVTSKALASVYKVGRTHESFDDLLADKECDSLLVATPHNLHPEQILKAAHSGKYTYCEKPVAIDRQGIQKLQSANLSPQSTKRIMAGFNRRFAPAIRILKSSSWMLSRLEPMEVHYWVNFGPRVDNAMSDPTVGGGRIHGAACHYVDILAYLVSSPIVTVSAFGVGCGDRVDEDSFVANFRFADGSIGSLVFTSEGSRTHDFKESLSVSCVGHTARVDDYAWMSIDGRHYRFWRHRYGAMQAWKEFLSAKRDNSEVPVDLHAGIVATQVTLAIQESIRAGGMPKPVISAEAPGND